MKANLLSIIVPVFNEEKTIAIILERAGSVKMIEGLQKELVIVNDCSTDGTEEKIFQYRDAHPETAMHYFLQDKNRGKGAAIHKGIEIASGEFIVVQDADLEYDPNEYNLLLEPVLKGIADVVYGSRFIGGKPHRILFFWHSIGNKFLTTLSNVFTNLNLTDMETCYKLFRSEILKSIHLREKRFGFEPEVTAKISRLKGIRIYEVGISYYGRTYEEGKKINWVDGFHAIYCIFKYGLFRAR